MTRIQAICLLGAATAVAVAYLFGGRTAGNAALIGGIAGGLFVALVFFPYVLFERRRRKR